MTYAIEAHDLIKIFSHHLYGTKISALRGCDLQVSDGELISVIGPSGAGKTTLMNIISGILPSSGGTVAVGGVEIQNLREHETREFRRRYIGTLSQHGRQNIHQRMKVADVIRWDLNNANWDTRDAKERTSEILDELSISHLAGSRAGQLSAGEAMRVSLAKAVAKKPYVVLADEPTGQLDTENMGILFELMRKIAEQGTAIVVATHDIRFQALSDRSLMILDGRLASEEYAASLLDAAIVERRSIDDMFTDITKESIAFMDSSHSIRLPQFVVDKLDVGSTVRVVSEPHEDFVRLEKNPDDKSFSEANENEDYTGLKHPTFSFNPKGKEEAIRATKLTKSYGGRFFKNVIFSDLDLEIAKGDFVLLLGPSGAGKTTLLNLVSGLDSYDSGELDAIGLRLSKSSDAAKAKHRLQNISVLSQNYILYPYLTVIENAMLPHAMKTGKRAPENDIVKDLLKTLELSQYEYAYPDELSGGQMQRAALASVLSKDADLVLVDEPTANLDHRLAQKIMDMLVEMAVNGRTVLCATHDLLLARPGFRVIVLEDGIIMEDVRADDEFCDELKQRYLSQKR